MSGTLSRIHFQAALLALLFALALAVAGCGSGGGEGAEGGDGPGEHGPGGEAGGEGSGEGGEESGASLALDAIYDEVRKGARLILQMEAAFVGQVENTTGGPLQNVRVEVHLSNGEELGPVLLGDLAAGEVLDVEVPVTPQGLEVPFTGWTPHAEVGAAGEGGGEHGPGGEGSGEGGGEGGEESGASLPLDAIYDEVRKGARLVLEFEAAFVGQVENTTGGPLQNVRVEVHLSNGVELGPVLLGDLASGEVLDVEVFVTPEALAVPFTGWTPHAEVGAAAGGGNGG